MSRFVVLLRAVNVGGRTMRMAALRDALTEAGYADVETHIQSGNVVLSTSLRSQPKVQAALEELLESTFGYDVSVIVRTPADLVSLADERRRSPLGADARHYVCFLQGAPDDAAADALASWDVTGERLDLDGRDLHIWLDKPFNEMKATNARIEKLAGQRGTARDFKVVAALADKWCR